MIEVLFVLSFYLLLYFGSEAWRVYGSPEFERDLDRLREQRRRRKAARR